MSDKPSSSEIPPIQGPLSPGAEKALKIAVVAMGIMMVVGVAVVIGRILYLANKPRDARPRGAEAVATSTTLSPKLKLALPVGAQIKTISLSATRLAVHFRHPVDGTSGIRIIDLTTGGEVSRIEISKEAR